MMKKVLVMCLMSAMCLSQTFAQNQVKSIPAQATETRASAFSGGAGSEEDPYLISTAEDLVQLSADVNAKNAYKGTFFKMTNDIDMSSVVNFLPIGNNHGYDDGKTFMGVFDGDNYTISNLVADYEGKGKYYQGVALFGIVWDATIKNVRIENSKFIGYGMVSAVVSVCFGSTVQNCHVGESVTVIAEKLGAGGISAAAMMSKAVIEDCSSAATVTAHFKQGGVASGILGCVSEGADGTIIRRCVNYGTITSDFDCSTGILSLVEYPAVVEDCANFGKIVSEVGGTGIAYYATRPDKDYLIVKNCYNVGQINGQEEANVDAVCLGNIFQGGGEESCKVENCYFAEDTEGAKSRTATAMQSADMKTQDFADKLNNGRANGPWHIAEGQGSGFPIPSKYSVGSDQGGGTEPIVPDPDVPDPDVPDPDVPHSNYTMSIKNTTALAGTQITLPVDLVNADSITAFQFDIYLPVGITLAKDNDGFEMIDLSTDRTSHKRHVLAFKEQTDGAIRVLCYSLKNLAFTGNEGHVINITVDVDPNMKDGEYDILLNNVVLSKPSSERIQGPDTKSVITISASVLGDVNQDSVLDISDVVSIVSIIQGDPASEVKLLLADVNKDTCIDVADIVTLVNIILSQEHTPMKSFANMEDNVSDDDLFLSIGSSANSLNDKQQINVSLNNAGKDITALQFDLFLSDGLSLDKDGYGLYEILPGSRTSDKRHVFNCKRQKDGSYRIVVYSNQNLLFTGEYGDVLSLALSADNVSMSEVMIKNIVVCDRSAKSYRLADVESSLTLDCPAIDQLDNFQLNGSDVYSIDGTLVKRNAHNLDGLAKGVYVINNRKIIK